VPRKHAVITFVLALTSFLATAAGAVMLVAPHALTAHAGQAMRAAQHAAGAPAAAAAGTPGSQVGQEFPLVAGAPAVPRPGQPSRLVIPSIGLDAPVVEVGITVENGKPVWETAAFAVGFYRGSALPGTRGNTVMAGHISSPVSKKGDIFRRLPEVRIGDRIDVFVGDRRVSYDVTEIKVVPPTAVQVMAPMPDAILTLITCYPDGVYSSRLVVVGRPVGQAS